MMLLGTVLSVVQAEEEREPLWSPDYAQAQFAGTIGFLSAGAGEHIGESHWDMTLLFGYLPEAIGGDEIYTLALKVDYNLPTLSFAQQTLTPYAGMGVHYALNREFRTAHFDPEYYPATEWNVMPYLGLRIKPAGGPGNVSLYAELGVLGNYLVHYYNNPDYLDWDDVVNLSIGLRFALD